MTVPAFRARKGQEPLVMLTAYTARMAELLDPCCDALLVGDSLAQTIYGLPSTVPVTLDTMIAHGAAVARARAPRWWWWTCLSAATKPVPSRPSRRPPAC